MPLKPRVEIEGLKEVQKQLRDLDPALAKELKQVNLAVAEMLADRVRPKVPVDTGAARASVKAVGEQRYASIRAGGSKAPYFGFLDYGNKPKAGRGGVGRGDSHPRPWRPEGRYVYPTVYRHYDDIVQMYVRGLDKLLNKAGL